MNRQNNLRVYISIGLYTLFFYYLAFLIKKESIFSAIIIIQAVFLIYFYILRVSSQSTTNVVYGLIFAGVLLRFIISSPAPERLSDDVYRYIWDGKVQVSGINPYSYHPSHKKLIELRDEKIYPHVNNKHLKTIYPPGAQIFFRFSYLISGGNLNIIRVIYFFMDMIILYFLFKITPRKQDILIYWLSPLLLIEVYTGMHIDILGVMFLVVSVYLLRSKKDFAAVFFLCISGMIKYISFLILPVYLIHIWKRSAEKRKQIRKIFILSGISVVTIFICFKLYGQTSDILESLSIYIFNWSFNGSINFVIRSMFPYYEKIITPVLIGVAASVIYLRYSKNIAKSIIYLFMFTLLISHTLYPWYLIWLIPFLVFYSKVSINILLMLIFLSYYVLISSRIDGVWEVKPLVRILQYFPFYSILLIEYIKKKRCIKVKK